MTNLHPVIEAELRQLREAMTADGTLPPRQRRQSYYDTFRRKFGPEVLRALDGQELLEHMHAHGTHDSLVYWLEFKDDEEFPAIFGSITGGSALKFGVYRRIETGTWATKGTGSAPKDISLEEAIAIARRHRDQLLAAVKVFAAAVPDGRDEPYLAVQRELERVAPDVEDTAWAHKYFSLLFPDLLDTFHVSDFQRYHLTRLLQVPPRQGQDWAKGRYVCAGRYVALARHLDVPLHEAANLLNRRNGAPLSYWRLGTTDDERARRKYWPLMRDGDLIAVGWQAIGDLSNHRDSPQSKQVIREMVTKYYPNAAPQVTRSANELFSFVTRMSEGDRVAVVDGQTVLGIAEIAGAYTYDASAGFPHQRPVLWRSLEEWKRLDEGLRTSVVRLKDPENLLELERHILDDAESLHTRASKPKPPPGETRPPLPPGTHGPLPRLKYVAGQLQAILERKYQAILYGPPGTGKTYWALQTTRDLASLRAFGMPFDELAPDQQARLEGVGSAPLVRMISFHPEYGYEDFIEGYRPAVGPEGSLVFRLLPGQFRRICGDAAAEPHLDFFLIIDEINRGDAPRIFGELLTLLEHDKRGKVARLAVSGEEFRVPPNVFVVGTMNTADRSIALLDVALRRRFGFVPLVPDYSLLQGAFVGGLPLGPWLKDLNDRIRATGGGDARNRQIGHAYLLAGGRPISTIDQLAAVLRDDIVPLLEEYCYDDFSQLAEIVGDKLIDVEAQRVRQELFESGRGTELVGALMRPEIITASGAIVAESLSEESEQSREGEELPDEP